MIYLLHESGGKSYLVSIGGITVRRFTNDRLLRKLSGKGLLYRYGRISSTCDPHSLVDIGASGKRISYGTAKTGSCASEGFYFCGMIVSLVLEIEKPILLPSVDINGNDYRAGVDLLRFLLIVEEALLLQYLRGYGRDVHETDIFPVTSLV